MESLVEVIDEREATDTMELPTGQDTEPPVRKEELPLSSESEDRHEGSGGIFEKLPTPPKENADNFYDIEPVDAPKEHNYDLCQLCKELLALIKWFYKAIEDKESWEGCDYGEQKECIRRMYDIADYFKNSEQIKTKLEENFGAFLRD